jgi:hypothetical protein
VRLHIEGGNHAEKYLFHFEVSASGEARYEMSDELSGRRVPAQVTRLEPAEVERLLKSLSAAKLKKAAARLTPRKARPIPPCSLIGRLEVWDGRSLVQLTFMADPGQAEQAGHKLPAELERVVEAIFSLAARAMGLETASAVRP